MTALFVISTIIIFLCADWVVRRLKGRALAVDEGAACTVPVRMPEGVFFAPSHAWLNLYPSGTVRLGVDDFIARLVDTPEIALLKKAGEHIRKGDPLIRLQDGPHSLTVRSPLDGDVLAINEELAQDPSLLQAQMFSNGWGYVIKPRNVNALKEMFIGTETRAWISNEFQRLRDFFARMNTTPSVAPAYLQDGGPPIAGVLRTMDGGVWEQLDREFLEVQ